MYISRSPILLNQVQAMVPLPLGILGGMVNSYSYGSGTPASLPMLFVCFCVGQPPSIDLITFQTECRVGWVLYVIETWQEPPPWTAWPVNVNLLVEPRVYMFEAPSRS